MRELREGVTPEFIKILDEKLEVERIDAAQFTADIMIQGPA